MKKITIEELANLVKGKFWNIETESDFNFSLEIQHVIISVDQDIKAINFFRVFVNKEFEYDGATFSIEDYTEAVEEIEHNDNKIIIRLLNFPDLVISECN